MVGDPSSGKQPKGGPDKAPQEPQRASASPADAVKEDYRSEGAVALHEVRSLPGGREVYVQVGGIFLLADAATAERRLRQQQQQQ
ncbi:hypothetical protein, conserved [Eimeria tenella]|uniref:Prefoldin subunit n=1 Tax=Eimeria tenella TaxID=5802 RepID=U6KW53_EIMTE|nr:hypothetical protein, conserved [Eimeria tenella]CDJ41153.1 hypothetical protein, conserved [Eimeria tenella]|eukprot:XP_013231903.1 hypothetical protein, conserved [Eimeria tenella]